MHHKCNYTYDTDGTVAALTPNEERRLWQGLRLWHEEIENHDADGSGGSTAAKERQKAKSADKRRFNELVEESAANADE